MTPVPSSRIHVSLAWLCRVALGVIFVAAAFHKIRLPADFALNIFHYQLAPDDLVNALAILLPWLELITGVALIVSPRFRYGAAVLILAMLILFTASIAISLARGLDITCGCFSSNPEGQRVGLIKLAENTAMILGAMYLVWWERATGRASAYNLGG